MKRLHRYLLLSALIIFSLAIISGCSHIQATSDIESETEIMREEEKIEEEEEEKESEELQIESSAVSKELFAFSEDIQPIRLNKSEAAVNEEEDENENENEDEGGNKNENEDKNKLDETESEISGKTKNKENDADDGSDEGESSSVREEKYTYTDMTATMYTTAPLNVRSGPSVDYDVIGGYTYGAEVTVTGQCNETSWYRVSKNETTGYVSYKYLTDEKPKAESKSASASGSSGSGISVSDEMATRSGMCGRLYIPSQSINVAIFCESNSSNWQSVVDRKDSALCISHGTGTIIADHVNQAFANLKYVQVGDTMTIDYGTYSQTYTCVKTASGYNGGEHLYYNDGTKACEDLNGQLCLYTCRSGGITLTYWQ